MYKLYWCFNVLIIAVNGAEISWGHLKELYYKERAQTDDSGLAFLSKIKFENVAHDKVLKNRGVAVT